MSKGIGLADEYIKAGALSIRLPAGLRKSGLCLNRDLQKKTVRK